MQDTSSQPASAPTGKRRPKLDLNALGAGLGERKRGKSMFGVLLNTLNKAKAEDKERSASEAVSLLQFSNSFERVLTYNNRRKRDNFSNKNYKIS